MQKTANTLIFLAALVISLCWYLLHNNPGFIINRPLLIGASVLTALLVMIFLVNRQHQFGSHGCGIAGVIAYISAALAVHAILPLMQHASLLLVFPVVLLLGIGLTALLVVLVTLGSDYVQARRRKKNLPLMPMELDHPPLVSILLPLFQEPPAMVIETLDALARLHYPRFEVVVLDHGSDDALWQPVRDHCAALGEHFRFYHQPETNGLRARALNLAWQHSSPEADIIAVVHADSRVDPNMLHDLVPQFQVGKVAIVHASQRFRDADRNLFKAICSTEYQDIFHAGLKTRGQHDFILHHGKISLIRRSLLEELGGWDASAISEDADLDIRACELGHEVVYNPAAYASGLTPDTFAAYRQQRFRWSCGAMDIVRRHSQFRDAGLRRQWHLFMALLPWLNDSLIVAISLAALAWSVVLIALPGLLQPPPVYVSVLFMLPLLLKIAFQIHHLRSEVQISISAAAAAILARLSLSHITAHALIEHFRSHERNQLRTPKQAAPVSWRHSLRFARQEILLLAGLALCLGGLLLHAPEPRPGLLAWLLLLLVQMLPYLAALLMALISGLFSLPARWLRNPAQ